jgi:ArsR family transcriptional regulator
MKDIEGLSPDEERAAAIFRAMGNPARVRIVRELAARSACATGDLVDVLPLAQSTVSQHLKILKEAGIVRGVIEGGDQCYCLEPEAVRWLANFTYDICCPGGEDCSDGCGAPSHINLDDLVLPAAAPSA